MNSENQWNQITDKIIGSCIRIHKTIGPGLLESAYEACLAYELSAQGLFVERQKGLPLVYGEMRIDCAYRLDLLIERLVVVEIKSVDALCLIHQAQLISYLKLSKCRVGLLINFNVDVLRKGIRRVVVDFPESQRPLRPLR